MAIDQSWLDGLLSGYNQILINGVPLPQRKILNLLGVAGSDDAVLSSSDITILGGGGANAITLAPPPPVGTWTKVGYLSTTGGQTLSAPFSVQEVANGILLQSIASGINDGYFLLPVPAGIAAPWTITAAFASTFTLDDGSAPRVLLCATDGTTAGTSHMLGAGVYAGPNESLVSQEATICSNRTSLSFITTMFSSGYTNPPENTHYFRIVFDGTYYVFQYSKTNGNTWITISANAAAASPLSSVGTITNFGVSVMPVTATDIAAMLLFGIEMATAANAKTAVTSQTYTGNGSNSTVVASTSGFHIGDQVVFSGVTGGSAFNGLTRLLDVPDSTHLIWTDHNGYSGTSGSVINVSY
jgi:hypothetical protein